VPAEPTALRRSLPNALTIARIVLAGVFFALLALHRPGEPTDTTLLIAAGLFLVAALTDALDGHLARKWRVVSRFGRVMDPFADKVLVLGAFIMLAGPGFAGAPRADAPPLQLTGVEPWMVVVILARELLVTSLRGLVEAEGGDFSASWSGKWKMILQSVAVPLILVLVAITPVGPGSVSRWVIDTTVWLTVAVTALSAIPYLRRAFARKGQ